MQLNQNKLFSYYNNNLKNKVMLLCYISTLDGSALFLPSCVLTHVNVKVVRTLRWSFNSTTREIITRTRTRTSCRPDHWTCGPWAAASTADRGRGGGRGPAGLTSQRLNLAWPLLPLADLKLRSRGQAAGSSAMSPPLDRGHSTRRHRPLWHRFVQVTWLGGR